jgi:hypothetical protein
MRTRGSKTREDLRLAIEALPRRARVAMLEGIEANPIIVGAYSTRDGICPMLAAHRAGGRSNALGFAKAWDGFGFRQSRRARPRPATERELLILKVYLQASLLAAPAPESEPPVRTRERLEAIAPAEPAAVAPGDPDRRGELGYHGGWAWTRLVRRYDEYERLLELLDESEREPDEQPALNP